MVDTAEPSLLAHASCTAALPQAPQAPQFPVKTHPVAVSCSRPSPLSRLTGVLSQVLACLLSRDPGPPQEAGGQQVVLGRPQAPVAASSPEMGGLSAQATARPLLQGAPGESCQCLLLCVSVLSTPSPGGQCLLYHSESLCVLSLQSCVPSLALVPSSALPQVQVCGG